MRRFPIWEFSETIKWATLNGAEALDMEEELGSLGRRQKAGFGAFGRYGWLKT